MRACVRRVHVRVCMCVCTCTRARACVCVCVHAEEDVHATMLKASFKKTVEQCIPLPSLILAELHYPMSVNNC